MDIVDHLVAELCLIFSNMNEILCIDIMFRNRPQYFVNYSSCTVIFVFLSSFCVFLHCNYCWYKHFFFPLLVLAVINVPSIWNRMSKELVDAVEEPRVQMMSTKVVLTYKRRRPPSRFDPSHKNVSWGTVWVPRIQSLCYSGQLWRTSWIK